MMYGIFGDVHGEVERLELVLDVLMRNEIKDGNIICLGDIVSDNDPEKTDRCIELLIEKGILSLKGNHDEVLYDLEEKHQRIKDTSLDYLRRIMRRIELQIDDTIAIHDNPLPDARNGMGRWSHGSYIYKTEDAKAVFDSVIDGAWKWLVGHNHISGVFVQIPIKEEHGRIMYEYDFVNLENGGEFVYQPRKRYIFSPGSVADSRDSNPNPACAIYNSETKLFKVIKADGNARKEL